MSKLILIIVGIHMSWDIYYYYNNNILFANVQNREQQKSGEKLVVKKHNDRLPEKQKCSFKLVPVVYCQ